MEDMARSADVGSKTSNTPTLGTETTNGQSSSRLRVGPQHSDVHDLGTGEAFSPLSKRQLLEPIQPPAPLQLAQAIDKFGPYLPPGCDALQSLQLGDFPRAVAALLQEIHRLNEELEASRDDFDALLAVNASIQDRTDEILAVADDQRVKLLEDLERSRDETMAFENQLEECRQQFDSADAEITELRAELVECQNRLRFLE